MGAFSFSMYRRDLSAVRMHYNGRYMMRAGEELVRCPQISWERSMLRVAPIELEEPALTKCDAGKSN